MSTFEKFACWPYDGYDGPGRPRSLTRLLLLRYAPFLYAAVPDEPQLHLYRLLVENSLGLMCIHDLDGVLLAVNPAVTQSLGYAHDEGVGRCLRHFLAPSVRHLFDSYLARIRSNPSDSGLMRLVAKDGTERIWFYRNVRYDAPGEAPRVLGHALDVTERMRAERALKEAQQALQAAHDELAERVAERTADLQQANEMLRAEMAERRRVEEELLQARKLEALRVLAGGIAHDFNNFLAIVQGNIALAQMRLEPADPVREILQQSEAACRRAAALALQLLTFGKGGAPVRRIASVAHVVKDAVTLARAGAQVSIDLVIADDLWAAEIDSEQIGQALYNILLNAREAMPEGGIIEVRAENVVAGSGSPALRAGKYVRLSVHDYGCGIPSDILPRVFDPYFTTKRTGHGLGLATAYAIVVKHQGHITVESKVGVETSFSIYLPASDQPVPSEPEAGEVLHRGSGRILVMDDEAALRKLMARTLEALGYEVECARDGAETVALYERAKAAGRGFDVVLLDLTVPGGMGGVEAAAWLRGIDPTVKLIVSSGYSDAPVMSEFRSYGFDEVIPKPWTPSQVSEVFRRVLVTNPERRGDENAIVTGDGL